MPIHNDMDVPFAVAEAKPVYLDQMKDLLRRHPGNPVIWAHLGLGRAIHPVQTSASAVAAEHPPNQRDIVVAILGDPTLAHVYFDCSWNEVAKYVLSSPESLGRTAEVINRFPNRVLFGTDAVAPRDSGAYLDLYRMYEPLWRLLTPEAKNRVLKANYERLFDAARLQVRAWEKANVRG